MGVDLPVGVEPHRARPAAEYVGVPKVFWPVASRGFSVNELMAWASGEHTAAGTYEDDSTVDVAINLARTEDPAELVTQEEGVERTPGEGVLGDVHLGIDVSCPSPTLTFPTLLSVSTADGLIGLSVTTTVEATDAAYLAADADIATSDVSGFPLPEGTTSDGPCESGDPDYAFVRGYFASDGSVGGAAGWGGEVECSDGSTASWARYSLEWGREPD